ncbi:N-formylglutamate amidohydrolase [Martelella lutilitoris]|uniref:N-formylglutamate amidohydrolase n=1 Tax=Martelella lutilitoris TaxID=2583532 RepID=A0A7T7KKT3_9HYPH|nr:N-formylglutamate amidohydrolase [Martelella lutilitoris]QQM29853.1 N-formylglutamate amidohydrolase [Martelella lutilitoris]
MPKINAYARIAGKYDTGLVLLADHAMADVPGDYGALGLQRSVFARHVAYDIGVEALTRALAARLSAPAVLSTFSRLLVDPNRGEDDPTLIMRISDGAIIPGNHPLAPGEREKRLALFHRPYHEAVERAIGEAEAACGRPPLVISLHSFTPFWKETARPWHAGVLWDGDPRAARPLLAALSAIEGVIVGDNEPYDGALKGDTMNRHCMSKGIAHALIEIRQDLIADDAGVALWADRLAPILADLAQDETLHARRHFPSRA